MFYVPRSSGLVLLLTLSALLIGCGGKQGGHADLTPEQGVLVEIYEVYRLAAKKNQKPPTQLADLKEFQAAFTTAVDGLKDGQYTVVWGTPVGKGNTSVLAYEKEAPQQGGTVVLADGTVQKMSADEVQAAVKAKG